MKYVLCVLLALVVGGKSFAKGNGDLNLKNFPEGYVQKEIGAKLGRHFIPGTHFLHDGKWIHYAEVCTWLGALRYAQVAGDDELIGMLEKRFEPLFTEEQVYLPIKNHVDLNMFGCLPLEFYRNMCIRDSLNADRDYLSPIPTDEILKNPNLTQNPGWDTPKM